jgi:hypothetical protein
MALLTKHIIFLALLSLWTNLCTAQEVENERYSDRPKGLDVAWHEFTSAVINNYKDKLKTLSTACILCSVCLDNTENENKKQQAYRNSHPNTWYNKEYNKDRYVPVAVFLSEDLSLIFDTATQRCMTDTSNFTFHNDSVNKHLYEKKCIMPKNTRQTASMYEVFVTMVTKDGNKIVYQKAFAFIRIADKYLFCGYSTIP